MNAATAGIIEMHAYKNCVLLPVLDCHAFVEWNENIGGSSHYGFDLRFAEFLVKSLGHVERSYFLWRAVTPISAAIFSAVAGIDHHNAEGFAGVLSAAAAEDAAGGRAADEGAEQKREKE